MSPAEIAEGLSPTAREILAGFPRVQIVWWRVRAFSSLQASGIFKPGDIYELTDLGRLVAAELETRP